MSLPVTHLSQDAVAALVDGELSCGAAGRAARHLSGCAQCRMAVQAQREAKSALLDTRDVAVPTDLLSRLRDIPFTADVGGSPSVLSTDGSALTASAGGSSWSLPLTASAPEPQPGHARWFRRSMIGVVTGVGIGVAALAANLPTGVPWDPPVSVAGPGASTDRTEVVPPVVRTVTVTRSPAGGTP